MSFAQPRIVRCALMYFAACMAWAMAGTGAQADDAHAAGKPAATGPRVVSIAFRGQIKATDVDRLRQAIALAGAEPLPARLIVFFDSGGGDGLAAMRIGRMLRHAKAHVFVTKRCASACIFAFLGGVYRDAAPNSLGIHRGRVTVALEQGRTLDLDPGKSPVARQFLTDAEAQSEEHLIEMGAPATLFEAMQAVPSNTMRWLTADEAGQLGLTGFEPEYLTERGRELQARYGIPEDDYVRRAHGVLPHCAGVAAQHSAFVACYRRQLLSSQ